MNRLATAQSQATSGTDCWGLSYGYDRYANLLSESVTKCSAPTLNLSVSTSTNQITNTGFSYDAGGNLTGDGSATYTWNAAGLMATTAGVTYTYDGDGRRVKKSNGKLYWYGLGGQVLAESDTSGNITSEYIFFGGMRIARRDVSSGNFYNFLGDRLGNARVVTDSSGTVVEASDYYPFGQERVVTGTGTANNYKYTQHERDSESGLDHTEYRQLSSALGRWLSPDPKRGSPDNPQSWDRYSYGKNSPCNYVDLDGGEGTPPPWWVYASPRLRGFPRPEYFQDDKDNQPTPPPPLSVTNFSKEGDKQDKVREVLGKVSSALASGTYSKCSDWLQGNGMSGSEWIQQLIDNNLFGHGEFSGSDNAEFDPAFSGSVLPDGTPVPGLPEGSIMTVNDDSAFFIGRIPGVGRTITVGKRNYTGGTLRAQAEILIHELAHQLGAEGFKNDFSDDDAGKENNGLVDQNCRALIEHLE